MTAGGRERSRFHRRQWRRRLAALKPVLYTLLVVGVLGFAGWVLFFSSWLAVQEVEVEGTTTLAVEQVVAAADVEAGTALVRVDLDAVTDRVEDLPEVESASVHRSWPDTVTITVTERTPVAAVRRQGSWWVMDGSGVVFRRTGDRDPTVPVVQTPPSLGEAGLREVAAVVQVLPDDILDQTDRVRARTMDSITLLLQGRRQVVWGSAAESDRKVEVLRVLLEQRARVYDVSVPEQPTTSG